MTSTDAPLDTSAHPEGTSSDAPDADLTAADVAWDLDPLLDGTTVDDLLDRSDVLADQISNLRGTSGEMSAGALAEAMGRTAEQVPVDPAGLGHQAADDVDPRAPSQIDPLDHRFGGQPARRRRCVHDPDRTPVA